MTKGWKKIDKYNGEAAVFLIELSTGWWDILVGVSNDEHHIVSPHAHDSLGWDVEDASFFCEIEVPDPPALVKMIEERK